MTNAAALILRAARLEDAAAISVLSGELGYAASEHEISARLAHISSSTAAQAVFVAILDGAVVGWIDVALTFHLQTPPFALIGGLVVKEGVRGLRIGKKLCERAEEWSRQQGVSIVRVTSRATRTEAHRFYLREGYTDVKTSRVFEKVLN